MHRGLMVLVAAPLLLVAANAIAFCDYGFQCGPCVATQQAYQRDLDSGDCSACLGLCKFYSPEKDGSLNQSPSFIPFASSEASKISVDIATLRDLASTNPWAAYALFKAQSSSYMSMRHGETILANVPTQESVGMLLDGASGAEVVAAMQPMPTGYTGKVNWDLVSIDGRDELIVRTYGGDSTNQEEFDVYPAVALSVGDGTAVLTDSGRESDHPSILLRSWRSLE